MCVVHSFYMYTHLLLLHSCVHMIQSYLSKKLSGYPGTRYFFYFYFFLKKNFVNFS